MTHPCACVYGVKPRQTKKQRSTHVCVMMFALNSSRHAKDAVGTSARGREGNEASTYTEPRSAHAAISRSTRTKKRAGMAARSAVDAKLGATRSQLAKPPMFVGGVTRKDMTAMRPSWRQLQTRLSCAMSPRCSRAMHASSACHDGSPGRRWTHRSSYWQKSPV